MQNNKYKLRYLPVFYQDLGQAITYIATELKNTKAAQELLDAVEKAILERLPIAESFEKYHSQKERRHPYYRIYVGNYIIYYVVIKESDEQSVMEVRRFLYRGRNREQIV